MSSELTRLYDVMARLRAECPWDAKQTHRTLVTHLVEETAEVVDAIETGDDTDLTEELGDLLMQVYFHARIAEDEGRGIADKLIRRHPHVFAGEDVPADMRRSWEAAKRAEKGRRSALDGIAESLDTLARTGKVVSRSRSHNVRIDLPAEPVDAAAVGEGIVALVARAQAAGIDADQATRDALRALEARIRAAENPPA